MAKLTKDDCLADLKLRILSTELAPDTALDEVSLAEFYGLSRTPLREVWHRLDRFVRPDPLPVDVIYSRDRSHAI